MSVRDDVSEVVLAAFNRVDQSDYAGYAACFTVDGAWDRRPGQEPPLVGRESILGYFGTSSGVIMRHVVGGLSVTELDSDRASVHTQVVLYVAPSGELPVAFDGPTKVIDYDDVVVRSSEGWRIAERRTTVVMEKAST